MTENLRKEFGIKEQLQQTNTQTNLQSQMTRTTN